MFVLEASPTEKKTGYDGPGLCSQYPEVGERQSKEPGRPRLHKESEPRLDSMIISLQKGKKMIHYYT